MTTPTARTPILQLKPNRSQGQHPGLILQRYLCEPATGDDSNADEKRELMAAAIKAAQNPQLQSLYQAAYQRWKNRLPANTQSMQVGTETGRMIIGLGSENITETGITLQHTFGMPYLPGSALKGLAAHYCNQVWSQNDPRFEKEDESDTRYHDFLEGKRDDAPENWHRLLFGTTDDSGCIIFHDAWFIPKSNPAPLCQDIMTPHHLDWLDGKAAPTDFDSPTPVPFLAVQGKFHIALSWNGPKIDPQQIDAWLNLAINLLQQALENWGIGGKTTSGYGRLHRDIKAEKQARIAQEAKEKEAQKAAQLKKATQNASPSLKNLLELQSKQNWKMEAGNNQMLDAFLEVANTVQDPPQDTLDFIRKCLESIDKYAGVWDNPNKTKEPKKAGKKKKKKKAPAAPKLVYSSTRIREIVTKLNPNANQKE